MGDNEAPSGPVPALEDAVTRINGSTRIVGLLADPVDHLQGFREFNLRFAALEAPVVMVPIHARAGDHVAFVDAVRRSPSLQGLVVSLPHKEAMMASLDRVGVDGGRIGAVNAVRREVDGTLVGDNFDGKGLVRALRRDGIAVAGRRALLLGAGGAGRSIAFSLADAGTAELGIYDIDPARAASLARTLTRSSCAVVKPVPAPDATGFDLVVNATPLGLNADDPSPVDPSTLEARHAVVDIVNRPVTRLVATARERGCATQLGNAMMTAQVDEVADFLLGRA